MTPSIVICSRSNSSRIPNKAFASINGSPILEHLIRRLLIARIDIILAVPHCDFDLYRNFSTRFPKTTVRVYAGPADDPLARMSRIAHNYGIDTIVRICHDKIFVNPEQILEALEVFRNSKLDYLYSSQFMDGSGFEIVSKTALEKASQKFKDVEHIGYAIKCVTDNHSDWVFSTNQIRASSHRLLIDYPADLQVVSLILSQLGNDCTLDQALDFMDAHPWVPEMNRLPVLSIYTTALNADRFIDRAMGSVASQKGFRSHEYLLIDDFSSDTTPLKMAQFASLYDNVTWMRNPANIGIASSSNLALTKAKGKYIMRLDADDYLVRDSVIEELVDQIETSGLDAIYPDNYYGNFKHIQKGSETHHVGGTIFRTRAANYVKFTDGLRGYEGYDFFKRAKDQIQVGYLNKPTFFYRQHSDSLSKTNLDEREELKRRIDEGTSPRDGFTMPSVPSGAV